MFRAHDTKSDRLVAIKVFRVDLTPERTAELAAELQRLVALQLTHPAIAAPIASGVEGAVAYLAEPFVPSESLDVALRQFGPAPFDDVLRLTTQLAGAIDFAAAVGAHHGGLHPRDVLVSSDEIRVTGFGVARALERVGVRAPVRRPYTAPERAAGRGWARTADVYSLAAIAFELLFGRRVAGTAEQIAQGIVATPGADTEKVRTAFARALADDPAERLANALSFATALKDAALAVGADATLVQTRRSAREIPSSSLAGDERRAVASDAAEQKTVVRRADVAAAPIPALPFPFEEGDRGATPSAELPESSGEEDTLSATFPTVPNVDPDESAPLDEMPFESESVDKEAATVRAAPITSAVQPADVVEPTPPTMPALRPPDPDPAPAAPPYHTLDDDPDEPVLALTPSIDHDGAPGPNPLPERQRSRSVLLAAGLFVGLIVGALGGYQFALQRAAAKSGPAAITSAPVVGRDATEVSVEPSRAVAPPAAPRPAPSPSSGPAARASTVPEPTPPPARTRDRNTRPPGAPLGRMLVRSTPAGAQVVVNGEPRGTTPVTVRNLPFGTHTIRVARRGYTSVERRVTITPRTPAASLTLALSSDGEDRVPAASDPAPREVFIGSLSVDSRPSGAAIYLNGQPMGETPRVLSNLRAGSYALRLERNGYARWSASVRVVAGERGRVTASLDRVQ